MKARHKYHDGQTVKKGDTCTANLFGTCKVQKVERRVVFLINICTKEVFETDCMEEFDFLYKSSKYETVKKTIFRVIGESGKGMYRDDDTYQVMVDADLGCSIKTHPCPAQDSLLVENLKPYNAFDRYDYFIADQFVFGFSSVEQMRRWLFNDGIIRRLDAAGATVIEMTGLVIEGHTQAVIEAETAIEINRWSLVDFFLEKE